LATRVGESWPYARVAGSVKTSSETVVKYRRPASAGGPWAKSAEAVWPKAGSARGSTEPKSGGWNLDASVAKPETCDDCEGRRRGVRARAWSAQRA
jgi:hypothetical protein